MDKQVLKQFSIVSYPWGPAMGLGLANFVPLRVGPLGVSHCRPSRGIIYIFLVEQPLPPPGTGYCGSDN